MVPAFDKVVFPARTGFQPAHCTPSSVITSQGIVSQLCRGIRLPGLHRLSDGGTVSVSATRQGISTRYRNTLHIRHIAAQFLTYLLNRDDTNRVVHVSGCALSTAPSGIALPRSPGCNSAINGFSSGTQA